MQTYILFMHQSTTISQQMFQGDILNFRQLLFYMANHQQTDSCNTCEICCKEQYNSNRIQRIPQDELKHETKTKIFTPIDNKTFFMSNHQKRSYDEINTKTNQCSNPEKYSINDEIHTAKRAKLTNRYMLKVQEKLTTANINTVENIDQNNSSTNDTSSQTLLKQPPRSPTDSESGCSESGQSETCSSSTSTQESFTLDNERHQHEIEKAKYERNIKLYQYIIDLLEEKNPCVMWISRDDGMFKIIDSDQFARLWGEVKLNPTMNYEKLARSFRHYYKKGIMDSDSTISKTGKRKLYYKFGETIVKSYLQKKT